MSGNRHITTIELEKGYLICKSDEAKDYVLELLQTGNFYEKLSEIFNAYVENGKSLKNNEADAMMQLIKLTLNKTENLTKMINTLPPPDSSKLQYAKESVVQPSEPKKIEEVTTKKKPIGKSGFNSLLNGFSKMKNTD